MRCYRCARMSPAQVFAGIQCPASKRRVICLPLQATLHSSIRAFQACQPGARAQIATALCQVLHASSKPANCKEVHCQHTCLVRHPCHPPWSSTSRCQTDLQHSTLHACMRLTPAIPQRSHQSCSSRPSPTRCQLCWPLRQSQDHQLQLVLRLALAEDSRHPAQLAALSLHNQHLATRSKLQVLRQGLRWPLKLMQTFTSQLCRTLARLCLAVSP